MISPTNAPIDHSSAFGTGSEAGGPTAGWPEAIEVSHQEAMNGLNPLQHLPVVGMIYRAATGEQIPTTMRVAGAGLLGGPLGMIGAGLMSLLEAIIKMGPDTSRPAVPAGMSATGSESGVEPVTPGTLAPGAYTTLATTTPDFLRSDTPNTALVQNGAAAYQSAALEWHRAQAAEKGLA
ncbi:MAG: hypothetical protein RQ966_16210 [Acetobacteraceae bacterium]|nr:hypothetical protein [Acetobacteraceae bacterium]